MFCTLKSIFFESNEHKPRCHPGQTSNGYKSLLIFFMIAVRIRADSHQIRAGSRQEGAHYF